MAVAIFRSNVCHVAGGQFSGGQCFKLTTFHIDADDVVGVGNGVFFVFVNDNLVRCGLDDD